jgi:hypothetical protein
MVDITPAWWEDQHKKAVWQEFQKWKKELDKILIKKTITQPLKMPPKEITKDHIRLLKEWSSISGFTKKAPTYIIWLHLRNRTTPSILGSVHNALILQHWSTLLNALAATGSKVCGSSKRDNTIMRSIWDAAWAYTGTFFVLPNNVWRINKKDIKEYPFQPCVDLWEQGLVPSFDGKTWRLHGGEDAKVLYEWTPEESKSPNM